MSCQHRSRRTHGRESTRNTPPRPNEHQRAGDCLGEHRQTLYGRGTTASQHQGRGIPHPLTPYVGADLESLEWRSLVPGVQHLPLSRLESGTGSTRLLRIEKGVDIPEHTHAGSALTLVLQGSYSDETGSYRTGDLSDLDGDVKHRPVVDSIASCICLIATDNRLIFSSRITRLIQPLIGI
ncbi:MAG: hypothetical protein GY703_21970 [Gammaproteobacteria bacterium]|nr:hypothetical protein [Gammaproteobacteria bacterium]